MLTLYSDDLTRNCEGFGRREILRIGTLGLGGLTLSNALGLEHSGHVKDRSVVILNMQGGPSQFETFDPKMEPNCVEMLTHMLLYLLYGLNAET